MFYGTIEEDFPDYVFRKADSFTTFNLNLATKRFANGLRFMATIYDIFDEEKMHPAGREHDQNLIPQDGRSFRLGLNYQIER